MNLPIRRYPIPESRLPFANTEIAQIDFQGQPHLVSSIWGGNAGGRLYFWNPDTGSRAMRPLPCGIPGAYMIKTGPDGRLYLGCGNGDLIRYDPVLDWFETLVTGEFSLITWGGCVTDRYVIWAASPGCVGVYDWREERLVKVFRPIDTEHPTALYGHRAVETPDGKVLLGMNVPQARLVLLDLDTMEARSYTPASITGRSWTEDATFFDEHTLAIFTGPEDGEFQLLRYPDFTLIDRIPFPPGTIRLGGRACFVDGQFYACSYPEGNLYRLDRDAWRWELLIEGWSDGDRAFMAPWQDRDLCAITTSGQALRYHPATGISERLDLEAIGPMSAHALCVIPEAGVIVGAPFINQRFWVINLTTGEGQDCGRAAPGGGQINQIIWDPITRRALMSSYTTAAITAYDPTRPAKWPHNPCLVASAQEHMQMRPMALAHDGWHVWMATSPKYGHLGGALCRINPQTGEILVWRHLVPDQRVNALVLDPDRRLVYCSTDVMADCQSAPPTQTTGQLVAFDMDALVIRRQQAIRPNAPVVRVHTLLPTGEVLAQESNDLYAWEPLSGDLRPLGTAPASLHQVIRGPDDTLWAAANNHIGRLSIEADTVRFDPLIDEPGRMLQIKEGILYYATGFEVCAIPLDQIG